MRQSVLLPLLLAALLPLTACARAEEAPETPEADGTAVKQVRLVDTAQDGSLIVAGEARGDVLTLSPDEVSILWDGVERSPEALRDGMLLEVGYGGTILETYPAQFYQPRSITVLEEGEDLCGLYLQVLNDLWADALGGESGVETIGVDASALEGLSEGETDAMAYAFGMAHQTGLPLRGTFDELTEQGYIEPSGDGPGRWPGGALFRLEGSADTGFQVCCWTGTEVIWRCSAAQDAAGNWSYRTDSAALTCGGSKPNIPKGGPPV